MSVTPQTLYLLSTEGYGMRVPYRCSAVGRLKGEDRDDYLLLRIEPPLSGGMETPLDQQILVATRHQGHGLFPIESWPAYVYVGRLLVPYVGQERVSNDEMELVTWAQLYATPEEAQAARR